MEKQIQEKLKINRAKQEEDNLQKVEKREDAEKPEEVRNLEEIRKLNEVKRLEEAKQLEGVRKPEEVRRPKAYHKPSEPKGSLESLSNSFPGTASELIDLGLAYYKGKNNLEKNYPKAKLCFEKAYEKGDKAALYYLGLIYQNVEKKPIVAAHHYQLAAYAGHSLAQDQLSSLLNSFELDTSELTLIAKKYYQGDEEILQDRAFALKLYEKARERHDAEATLFLAQLTLSGTEGREKEVNSAFSAYLQAAQYGNDKALNSLERLAEKASPSQQLALSQLYGTFFHNPEKASYWRDKSHEATQPQDIQFIN